MRRGILKLKPMARSYFLKINFIVIVACGLYSARFAKN